MKNLSKLICTFVIIFGHSFAGASAGSSRSQDRWIPLQTEISLLRLLKNISPDDALPGTVVASPSRRDPDYYFHWIRDAALVMDVVRQRIHLTDEPTEKAQLRKILQDFVVLSRLNQLSHAPGGFGEPKFHVDGSPYTGPWGRPQNDGPALRAITLIHWAFELLQEGQTNYVLTWLYRAELPAQTIIKADLEYVAREWRNGSFDLWEELKGDHFYTLMGQRKALFDGAKLARVLGDDGAAAHYESIAREIDGKLNEFWSSEKELIKPTINQTEGLSSKTSDIDSAVLLAGLHAPLKGKSFELGSPEMALSVMKLIDAFSNFYGINKSFAQHAPAIGRYPEDVYGGASFDGGNPWFLTTLAVAEYYFEISQRIGADPQLLSQPGLKEFYNFTANSMSAVGRTESETLFLRGEQFMERVRLHMDSQGSMAEQFHRDSGYMTSASDLTWSYAAFLTASAARDRALEVLLRKSGASIE